MRERTTPLLYRFLLFALTVTVLSSDSHGQQRRQSSALVHTFEGTVVERVEGAQWYGIVVESRGVKYTVQLGGKGGVASEIGNVTKIGARVRVYYKGFSGDFNGTKAPNATKIIRLSAAAAPAPSPKKAVYYISVARCDAGQYSNKEWQQTANTLQRGGIPAFFASHESLPLSSQVRGDWLLMRISQRYSTAHVDSLLLGPFSSKQAASTAVQKIPKLLSSEGQALV